MEISNKIPPIQNRPQTITNKPQNDIATRIRTDRVTLSEKARELQAAQEAVRGMPDVDMDKVSKIKAQLKEGTYFTDAEKIAGAMLKESFLKESE